MAGANIRVHDLSSWHGSTSSGDELDSIVDSSFLLNCHWFERWQLRSKVLMDGKCAKAWWLQISSSQYVVTDVSDLAHWTLSYTTLCLLCSSVCAVRQVARMPSSTRHFFATQHSMHRRLLVSMLSCDDVTTKYECKERDVGLVSILRLLKVNRSVYCYLLIDIF